MDLHIKQERKDPEFVSEYSQLNPNWKVYGSWIQTQSPRHKEELTNEEIKSCELLIPMRNETSHISNSFLYDTSIIRAQREFVPMDKKDTAYWSKRLKNNESARRSRLKKRAIEKTMEAKYKELQRENIELKHELAALKRHFGEKLNRKEIAGDVFSEPRFDMAVRQGSASDLSETSSVTSEGEVYHGSYEPDVVAASPLKVLTSSKPVTLPHQHGFNMTPVPFRYSFMNYPVIAKDRSEYLPSMAIDQDAEPLTKVPHKFRLKNDFHSAFYVHPDENNQ
ncbi:nuclear factor interleukin-3-regulated protein-like [Haliotis rubra]|uniref:nuclear factor interleukin-3-regulated protein-like n=1 Tax=Haliotis rubra TaxID=36100 RepID=UPI001EE54427|nr:nuclear factor interleukin-3-regulated protein-like [Haliotis rubra]XP_046567011.1 nuclear factor interleukin-3-regulated protein-like [Haliotis rubra]